MTESTYNKANWIQYVTAVLVIVALLLSFGAYTKDVDVDNSKLEKQIAELDEKIDEGLKVDIDVTEGNLTKELHEKIFEDDAWESEAEVLATEEWEERDYDDIADAINELYLLNQIDDRDDIEYVKEDENTKFILDADDKDGTIIQYVKVKYENEKGKDVKKYLTITSTFDDGELEKQEITNTI